MSCSTVRSLECEVNFHFSFKSREKIRVDGKQKEKLPKKMRRLFSLSKTFFLYRETIWKSRNVHTIELMCSSFQESQSLPTHNSRGTEKCEKIYSRRTTKEKSNFLFPSIPFPWFEFPFFTQNNFHVIIFPHENLKCVNFGELFARRHRRFQKYTKYQILVIRRLVVHSFSQQFSSRLSQYELKLKIPSWSFFFRVHRSLLLAHTFVARSPQKQEEKTKNCEKKEKHEKISLISVKTFTLNGSTSLSSSRAIPYSVRCEVNI